MQLQHSQSSPKKDEEILQPIITPPVDDPGLYQEFVLIDCGAEDQPITQFPAHDLFDISVKVIDYIYQKSYVVLSTETFIIKISQTKEQQKVQLQQSRSNSDFEWLKRTLEMKYPGIGIPVHSISGSIQNLTKQKIMVVEEFLNYLIQHPTLKYSPQVKAFVSDKIEYLEMRKEIELEPNEHTHHRSNFELSSLLSALTPWKKIKSLEEESLKIPNIKQVVPKQVDFRKTVLMLQKLILYSKKNNDSTHKLIQTQKQIFQKSPILPQFSTEKQRIKALYRQNQQVKQNQQSLQYLHLGIKMEMVKQNLLSYLQWFSKIRKIQEFIILFRENGEYNKSEMEIKYLKLLVNNMVRDMGVWTEHNNNLIQDAFYQL